MFNLLPQTEKDIIEREYRLRLVVTVLVFLVVLGCMAIIAIIPSFFIAYQKERLLMRRSVDLKKEVALTSTDYQINDLKLVKQKVAALNANKSPIYVHDLISKIIARKISGIKLSGLNVGAEVDGSRQVSILGKAQNRDVLFEFKKSLEKEEILSGITVPPSNFASSANINFTILAKTK